MIHAQEQSESPFSQVKKSWIKNYVLEPGRHHLKIPLNNGNFWDAEIYIPEHIPELSCPLIIALHWAGSDGTQKEYADCLAFPAMEALNGIIIAPSAEGMPWITSVMEKRVVKFVRQLIKQWPVDPNQIYITGYSNGGIGTWHYMNKYPKVFKKGIAMAGMYESSSLQSPIHVIHGEEDDLFPVSRIKKIIGNSQLKGSGIELTLIPEFTHYMACAYQEALAEIAREFFKVD